MIASDRTIVDRVRQITPVVISGAKRSGTTLLYRLLDSVPNTFNFLDEGYFFECLYDLEDVDVHSFVRLHRKARASELVAGARERMLFTFFDKGYFNGKGSLNEQWVHVEFNLEKLRRTLDRLWTHGEDHSIESLWGCWLAAFMEAMGYDARDVNVAILKSPDYGKSAVAALKWLKNAKAVIVVRDPRYAVDSLKRSRELREEKQLHPYELLSVLSDYKLLLKLTRLVTERYADRALVLRYEELIADPRGTMKRAADCLGMEFVPSMLRPTINGEKWFGLSSFYRFAQISSRSVTRPLKALSRWEREFLEEELDDVMQFFGYR